MIGLWPIPVGLGIAALLVWGAVLLRRWIDRRWPEEW